MPRGKSSRGTCVYCGQIVTKQSITKHLATCAQRQAALTAANQKGETETLYQLRIQALGLNEFWLNLEMRGNATLKDLDAYLRAIWLECCGHLSRFSVGGWSGDEIPLKRKAAETFAHADELVHIYDFGTSSETLIKVLGTRQGAPTTKRPIALLARNLMPEAVCMECQQPATWLCMECIIEENVEGTLCDEHAETHPHDNYGEPMPLVNSPRVGLCGYTGPADPPY